MDIHDRLKKARERRYEGATDAAKVMLERFQWAVSTYLAHENGTTKPPRDKVARYAEFFGVNPGWLLTGKGHMLGKGSDTPVLGYVGAGAEVFPIDDHAQGAALDTVETAIPENAVAVVIRGDSQYPLQDGWLVIYTKADQDGVPDTCLNRLCVAKIKDGPTLLKTVRRGRAPKTFSLESWNAPPRENEKLDWAAPVLAIKPR